MAAVRNAEKRLSGGGGTDMWEGPEGGRDKGGEEFRSESAADETEWPF